MTELPLERLRERAREFEEEHHEPIQAVVAVLIMVVTLLAAVAAYLQTQAGTREARANRAAQEAAVENMSSLVESSRNFSERYSTAGPAIDLGSLGFYLGAESGPYAAALASAYAHASQVAQTNANELFGAHYVTKDVNGGSLFDFGQFFEDQQKDGLRAAQVQKAESRERGDWASKRGRYITVITIFAVALFLLGLTLTVPRGARRPFLWMGSVVAAAATIWGIVVFASAVPKTPPAAINGYVDGTAKLIRAPQDKPGQQANDYEAAKVDLTRALGLEPDYEDALISRGNAEFRLDFLNPNGPQGSLAAAADMRRASRLSPRDYVAWGDLGAADFWLGKYPGAISANEQALAIQPDQPTFNLNEAFLLSVLGRDADYGKQVERIRAVFVALPDWLRNSVIDDYATVIRLALGYRPKIVPQVTRFENDVFGLVHQIDVSEQLYGEPTPPHVDATLTPLAFTLSPDATALRIGFRYAKARPADRLLYRTYLNGQRSDSDSFGPKSWRSLGFTTPAGSVKLTLREQPWQPGTRVRIEVYVNANLLSAGAYTIPKR